jgi:hypothetical protein
MRGRLAFLTGLAVGFVAGTRAGRERYEQMVKLSRKAAENPTVQNVARTATAKAAELGKSAGQKAAERLPKATATAKNSATKVRGQLDRLPGRNSGDGEPAKVNGHRSAD